MKPQFEIKDQNIINNILSNVEYGTLALCNDNIPYSVPVNFSCIGEIVYFHGSQNGKKAQIARKRDLHVLQPISSNLYIFKVLLR
jgi:hypothetical protein